ncbi:DNA glycosylase AlkZ-like family protein [Nonomuraea antimicrobica]
MHGAAGLEDLTRWLGTGSGRTVELLASLGPAAVPVTIEGRPGYALAEHLPGLRAATEPRTVRLLPAFDQWTITLPATPTPAWRRYTALASTGPKDGSPR